MGSSRRNSVEDFKKRLDGLRPKQAQAQKSCSVFGCDSKYPQIQFVGDNCILCQSDSARPIKLRNAASIEALRVEAELAESDAFFKNFGEFS